MQDRIAWMILSADNRSNRKMKELSKSFDKRKQEVDLSGEYAQKIMNNIESAGRVGAELITFMDEDYPEELRSLAYPPPYLFLRGNKELLKFPVKVTIVGSREATPYGIDVALTFAHELSANDVVVVSGGARGVDTAALKGALRTDTGVIAVIGTGINVCYPPENESLFELIAQRGLIVSEFPMGMGPMSKNFPIRNRVMTAISDSVLVVEAGEKSGAMISAEHAIEQGKTLFAVPGNITSPNSYGTNQLIRDGAMVALTPSDVLDELMERVPGKFRQAKKHIVIEENIILRDKDGEEFDLKNRLTVAENAVLNAIKQGMTTYEEILDFCAIEANKLTSLLTIMEIKGIIEHSFGNKYKLR